MPDGKHFIYLAADHSKSSEPAAIYFASLDGSQPRFLTNTGSAAKAVDGDLLYVSAGKLTAQPFNPTTGLLESNASVLAQDVQFDTKTWFASFTATKETLIYWSSRQPLPRQVISWFDERGTRLANVGSPGTYGGVRLSPDGKSIATSCGDPDANICIIHQDGSLTRLTNQPLNGNPAWSPDSSSLAYLASRDHSTNSVMVKRLSTDAQERDVAHGGSGFRNGSWSPDGTSLLVWQNEQEVSTLHVKNDTLTPYLTNIKGGGAGDFSPDGKWVAYVSSASGRTEVYVSSYPNPVHKFQISMIGGKNPRWRRDGRTIFFEGPQKTIYSVLVEERGEQLDLTIPRRLFSVPAISTQQAGASFDVDAVGKRFLINIDLPGRTPDLVLVTNWRAPDAGRQTSRSLNLVASF
jgi:Tol biopolymer transport system component